MVLNRDLNELANPNGKKGEQVLPNTKYQRLNNFLSTIDAELLQVNGNPFTWKKRVHTRLIYKRLNRTVFRKDWSTIYHNSLEVHGNFTCFDHCLIILSSNAPCEIHKAFPFHF